ncbi:stalk domain-containing protein [Brevibacillus sp. SYSU BS000544]|uniref:stalk domain-containing protein n=1 Tax=Brevibacillus sp. SYSU BS000544 TaxID=3416443 RepID=UPI003CE54980
MKKFLLSMVSLLLVFSLTGGLASADSVTIKIKTGSNSVTINGVQSTVETPYVQNGLAMVPLSVITKAFGATLSFDSKTQTVGLAYGSKSIQFKAGSNKAKVNGKEVTLPVAPQMKNNTLMVPLKFVAETLGATVSYDQNTKEIVLTGNSATATTPGNGFNEDVGKTKIGDSYIGWTMRYPSGLVKNDQSFKGDWVSFKDAKDEYELRIFIDEEQPENYSNDGLVKVLLEGMEGTILSKGFVKEGNLQYARAVTKEHGDSITEHRAYQNKDRIFYIMLTVNKEDNFKNPLKYRAYKDLLDSFTASFDKNDKTVKDISGVKDNYRTYIDENYGLTVKIPAKWEKNDLVDYHFFQNEDGTQVVKIKTTSITENDTLDEWIKRHEEKYRDAFVEEYLEVGKEIKDTTIAGVPAKERDYEMADGDRWYNEHDFFFFKGKYKYYIEIGYYRDANKAEIDALIRTVQQSLKIDPAKMNPALGFIQDEDMYDKTKTITIKSDEFNYSIEIPEYWKEKSGEEGNLSYRFAGGDFEFAVLPISYDMFSKTVEKVFEQKKLQIPSFTMIDSKSETKFGVNVKRYEYKARYNGYMVYTITYIFSKGGNSYAFDISINEENRSKANLERVQKALDSFKFIK